MLAEHKRLEKQISSLQSQLKSFPKEKLICAHNGKHFKWYHSDGHTKTYIPKKNRDYAEQLAVKKYLISLLEELTHEKTAIGFYLRHHDSNPRTTEQLLHDNSGYQELLTPYFQPLSQELLEWMNSPYEKNQQYPELLVHKTISGNYVRSKSEVLIDMALHMHNIPFRYECALYLNSIIPSIHLITTYETKENPLNLEIIEKTIEYYFL